MKNTNAVPFKGSLSTKILILTIGFDQANSVLLLVVSMLKSLKDNSARGRGEMCSSVNGSQSWWKSDMLDGRQPHLCISAFVTS